jgi:hypothetical protein
MWFGRKEMKEATNVIKTETIAGRVEILNVAAETGAMTELTQCSRNIDTLRGMKFFCNYGI